MDEDDSEGDDRPDEGSTCFLIGCFGLVAAVIYIGVALWLANK